jgi:hypothetical protein
MLFCGIFQTTPTARLTVEGFSYGDFVESQLFERYLRRRKILYFEWDRWGYSVLWNIHEAKEADVIRGYSTDLGVDLNLHDRYGFLRTPFPVHTIRNSKPVSFRTFCKGFRKDSALGAGLNQLRIHGVHSTDRVVFLTYIERPWISKGLHLTRRAVGEMQVLSNGHVRMISLPWGEVSNPYPRVLPKEVGPRGD